MLWFVRILKLGFPQRSHCRDFFRQILKQQNCFSDKMVQNHKLLFHPFSEHFIGMKIKSYLKNAFFVLELITFHHFRQEFFIKTSNKTFQFLKSFRHRKNRVHCSQPVFVWRRIPDQPCICIWLFFRFQINCV